MRLAHAAIALGFVVSQMGRAQNGPDRLQHIDSLVAVSNATSFGHTLQGLSATMALAQARQPGLHAQKALRAVCERSFPLDSAAAHLRRAFEGRYNPSQFDLMIAWFSSPLGRKVAEAERATTLLKGDLRQEVREKVRAQWVSSRRLLLLERLDGNLGLGPRQQTYALALLEDLIVPAPSSNSTDGGTSDAHVQRMLQLANDRLDFQLSDSLMFDMRVTYRSLSNDDLQRYNEFLEMSAGRWYVQMVQQGLENAFLGGREQFVDGVAAMPVSARKSYFP